MGALSRRPRRRCAPSLLTSMSEGGGPYDNLLGSARVVNKPAPQALNPAHSFR